MSSDLAETRRHIDEIDAAMQELRPGRTPLTDRAKDAIARSVAAAPPMTEQQCRRIGRLLAGSAVYEQATTGRPRPSST